MMKQDSIVTSNSKLCGNCGTEEKKLIHNVRVRGNFRRLCTSCVLRLHPQNFCPTCLGVYERSPPEDAVVCFKCYSYSHPHCVTLPPPGSITSNRGPSPCSSCLNPISLNLNRLENGSRSRTGTRVIDLNAARILLAAGKIASNSMNKAEVAAAQEAERRSKEAAYTKKRAREALDHVVKLMGKEKINNVSESSNNSKKVFHGSGNGMPYVVVNSNNNSNNKGDPSSEVLEALNAVELKESGRQVQGGSVESVVSNTQGNGVVGMEVDAGHGNGNDLGVNSVAENGSVKSGDDLMKVVEGENVCNGHEQGLEKVNAVEESSVVNPQHSTEKKL